jgi:hypothetical protein
MPKLVEVIPMTAKESVAKFVSGEIDIIGSATPIMKDDLEKIKNETKDLSIAKTLNLKIRMLFFSKKIIEETTAAERFFLVKKLRAFYDKIALPYETPTIEFFQDLSSGYLTGEQKKTLTALRESQIKNYNFKRKFNVAVGASYLSKWGAFFTENKEFEPQLVDSHPLELAIESRPDIFSGVNDVSYNKSLSVVAYNVNQGIFGIYKSSAKDWLAAFIKSPAPTEQIKMLNELHFRALSNCFIFPLASSPYFILTRNKWTAAINPFFSSTELWLIKKI